MGLFNNFPWTNLHELNLQWIVETLKKCYSPDNPPEAMVISVNGQSGVVTLYPEAVIRFPDVQDTQWNMWRNTDGVSTGIQFEKGQPAKRIDGQNRIVIYDANNPPPYPVVSVNGETGEIELYTEAYVEFPDITENNWGIQRKLNTGEANETTVGIMFDDTGKAMIIKDEDSNDLYSENNPPPYPVNSVDGNTGNVHTWGYNTADKINIPLPAPGDEWSIGRVIDQGGNLSIKIMYDDNIQKCTAYMIYDDGVNTPSPIKLLTLDDIPSSAGVVSFNGQTGALTITGADLKQNGNTNTSIDEAIEEKLNITDITDHTELTNVATRAYSKNEYIIINNVLYKVNAPIAINDTIDSNNTTITNICKELKEAHDSLLARNVGVTIGQDAVSTGFYVFARKVGNICIVTGNGEATGYTAWTNYVIATIDEYSDEEVHAVSMNNQGQVATVEIADNSNQLVWRPLANHDLQNGQFRFQIVFPIKE